MKALAEISTLADTPIRGIYRLVHAQQRASPQDGRSVIRLTIADASDTRICGFYSADSTFFETLRTGMLIAVEGRVARVRRAAPYVRLHRCKPVMSADRASWHLLPIVYVPQPARSAFTRLRGILNRLTDPALRDFMDRVMGDVELAERFVQSTGLPADGAGEPGRLLIDSVARAEKAERIAFRLMDTLSAELVIVGALLRDIGATFENGESPELIEDAKEAATIYVLCEQFAALETRSPHCALALNEMLVPESTAETTGGEARTLCKDLIRWLDKLDTGDRLFDRHTVRTSSGHALASIALPRR